MCKPRVGVGDGASGVEAFNTAGRWIPSQLVFRYGPDGGALVAAPNDHDPGSKNWSVSALDEAPAPQSLPVNVPATTGNQVGPWGEAFGAPQPILDTSRANFPGFRCAAVGQTFHCDANVSTTASATTGAGLTQPASVDIFNELPWLSHQPLGPRALGDDAFRATLSLAGVFTQYGCMIVNRTQHIAQCGLAPDPHTIHPVTCHVTAHNTGGSAGPIPTPAAGTPPTTTFTIQAVPAGGNAPAGSTPVPRFQVTYGRHTLPCFPIADRENGPMAGFLCGGADDSYVRVDTGSEDNQNVSGTSYASGASSYATTYSGYSPGSSSYTSYSSGGLSYTSYASGSNYASGTSYGSGMSYSTGGMNYQTGGLSYGSSYASGGTGYDSGYSPFNSYLAYYGAGMHVSIRVPDEQGVALGDCSQGQGSYSNY